MLPDIYKYLDYRQYLMDLFEALREKDPSISFRSFARLADSSSPNYLKLLCNRKINIHEASIDLIAKGAGLKKKEAEYLHILVGFDHAKSHQEKDAFFKKILYKREYKSIKALTKEQYLFFSHWYIPIIRELVVHPNYNGNLMWIARRVEPPITESKVRKGIALLSKLGLIKKDKKSGKWRMTKQVISTSVEVLSLAVAKYHRDVIALAGEAIDRFNKPERDIRSVTVGLSPEGFRELKSRLESFWKETLDFSGKQKKVTRVYQINTQLFPLSKEEKCK